MPQNNIAAYQFGSPVARCSSKALAEHDITLCTSCDASNHTFHEVHGMREKKMRFFNLNANRSFQVQYASTQSDSFIFFLFSFMLFRNSGRAISTGVNVINLMAMSNYRGIVTETVMLLSLNFHKLDFFVDAMFDVLLHAFLNSLY